MVADNGQLKISAVINQREYPDLYQALSGLKGDERAQRVRYFMRIGISVMRSGVPPSHQSMGSPTVGELAEPADKAPPTQARPVPRTSRLAFLGMDPASFTMEKG